jgi:signal peptidase I
MTDDQSQISPDHPDPADTPSPDQHAGSTPATTRKTRSMVREVIETLLLALLIFVAVRAVVLNFRVDGHSMDTSLHDNEMLLVNRNAYFALDQEKWLGWIPGVDYDAGDTWRPFGNPDRGDIVVLNPPSSANADKPYIKRVIGVPGDTLEVRDEGVYINGTHLDEPYLDGKPTNCPSNCHYGGPIEIPDGYVYVMGDNRTRSEDSRVFGLEPIGDIIGKAWVTYWPASDVGVVPDADYPGLGS